MEIRTLENTPLAEIVNCFNEAFSDYFVPISATEEAMKSRWKASRVDFSLSFGAFSGNRLVGFMITGVDFQDGLKTAYNGGTGVIPEFRGQRIVSQLYEKALPIFREQGIEQCTLEVITANLKAIKAYQNVGFKIARTLHCFKGDLKNDRINGRFSGEKTAFEISTNPAPDFSQLAPLQPYPFAWDNLNEGIKAAGAAYECWQLKANGNLKAYLFLNPVSGYIGQLGFDVSDSEIYPLALLQEVARKQPSLKLNNVDANSLETLNLLFKAGLENYLSQFEMRLLLKNA